MPNWSGSNRRERLPGNWESLRQDQFKKDGYRCTWYVNGERCPNRATEVDHIQAKTDDHGRLRSLCQDHHATKSGREGAAALNAMKAKAKTMFRRDEDHPGGI